MVEAVPVSGNFVMNNEYKTTKERTYTNNKMLVKNEAKCEAYIMDLDPNALPAYQPGFKKCAKEATTVEKARSCIQT